MNNIINIINGQGVPTNSAVAAAQHMGLTGIGQLRDDEYIERIKEISGETVKLDNSDMYRITYAYLVAEAIRVSDNTNIIDAQALLGSAKVKATKLIKECPWMFVRAESEPKLDAAGNVKPKKGAKKELAKQVFTEFIEGKVTVRKEAIAILVEKVGLTSAGASTYYANLKKGTL